MLELNSTIWKDLTHAYGSASDIPILLEQLKSAGQPEDYKSEPWFSLWSALCHQYNVYSASYAASPHIISIATSKSIRERIDHLLLVSSIEAFRHLEGAPPILAFLQEAYFQGLKQAFDLVHACLAVEWQETDLQVLLGAMAIFRGFPQIGSAIFELEKETE